MFNIHFSENFEKDFRQDLQEKLKLTLRETDAFMYKVRALFVSEEQNFPADFKHPSRIIRRMTERSGRNYDEVKKEIIESPVLLFQELKIPHVQKIEKPVSEQTLASLSPAMRLQMLRQKPSDRTRTFSLETSDLLAAARRSTPLIGKPVSRAYVEEQKDVKDTPPKRTATKKSRKGSRTKPVPSLQELAEAAHKIRQETGSNPNARSGKKHLPDDSPQWSTLIQHVLKGENTLTKIMGRYPLRVEESTADTSHLAAQETNGFDSIDISGTQRICPDKADTADVEIIVHDTKINARDVFNGLLRIARKNVLPTTSSVFHYIEGKTLRQLDRHFKKGEVAGMESFLAQRPPSDITSLNDFMLATGIARKSGKSIALSRPSELNKLAKTLG